MNRTRGFVNLNRFKSAKAIKRHVKVTQGKPKKRVTGKPPVSQGFGA
jgi:hypothetical protein